MNLKKERIKIAKDVIKHLFDERMKVETGNYCRIDSPIYYESGTELQSLLYKVTCKVCALGAAMLSHVRLHDNFKLRHALMHKVHNDIHDTEINYELEKYFTKTQLGLIEVAFESRMGLYFRSLDYTYWSKTRDQILAQEGYKIGMVRKAAEFGSGFSSDMERLRAIMQNIIDNDGHFCP